MMFTRGIWPLRKATIWYEPREHIAPYLKGYARVHIYAYEALNLPGFRLIREKRTPVIPVAGKDSGEILGGFRDTTRNEVRRTFAMPEVAFSIEVPSTELCDFYAAATRSQGRIPQKCGLFRDARFAVARKEGVVIAAISFVPAKPIVKILTISSLRRESADPQERNLIGFATKRLVYELCVFGVREGYEGVDLAYVNVDDPAKKGITDFKMGFGGDVRHEWQYERITSIIRLVRYLQHI